MFQSENFVEHNLKKSVSNGKNEIWREYLCKIFCHLLREIKQLQKSILSSLLSQYYTICLIKMNIMPVALF